LNKMSTKNSRANIKKDNANAPVYKKIESHAFDILEKFKDGIRFMELVRMINEKDNNLNINTIQGTIYNIHEKFPEKVYKPARGLFRLVKYKEIEEESDESEGNDRISSQSDTKRSYIKKEEKLYGPFVTWIQNELEEVTKAISLGGNKFGPKWLTPDVIGIRRAKESDVIKFQTEIISAEIKYDSSQVITGLGQAVSYKLFSHKVYLVVPRETRAEDLSILDSLCQINGIGLVLFYESSGGSGVGFEIKSRPIKNDPDPFYMNEYIKKVETELFG